MIPFQSVAEMLTLHELVPMCSYLSSDGTEVPCVEKLSHVATDKGICSAFNALSLQETFVDSPKAKILDQFYKTIAQ